MIVINILKVSPVFCKVRISIEPPFNKYLIIIYIFTYYITTSRVNTTNPQHLAGASLFAPHSHWVEATDAGSSRDVLKYSWKTKERHLIAR